jgi:Zn finger protein HypA/HybF involved in hydrogenase expression
MEHKKLNTEEPANSVLNAISSRFNLIWDADTNCENDFRSELLGKPIYDMKCNNCLSFVGAYHSPEDCEVKYCPSCGQKIERS